MSVPAHTGVPWNEPADAVLQITPLDTVTEHFKIIDSSDDEVEAAAEQAGAQTASEAQRIPLHGLDNPDGGGLGV